MATIICENLANVNIFKDFGRSKKWCRRNIYFLDFFLSVKKFPKKVNFLKFLKSSTMCLYYSLLEDPYHEMERRHGKSIDSFIKRGNGMCKDQTISICYQGYEIWIVTKVLNLNEFSLYVQSFYYRSENIFCFRPKSYPWLWRSVCKIDGSPWLLWILSRRLKNFVLKGLFIFIK